MKKISYFLLFLVFLTNLYSQPLNGTYSIGTGGNFTTITDALNNASQNGLSGPVILELSGSYNSSQETFPITINQYFGLNPQNTLTIRPASSVDSITITASGTSAFIFNGCSNVIIDGRRGGTGNEISLKIKSTACGSVINIFNDANNNIVSFTEISGDNTVDNLLQVSSGTFWGTSYNKIKSCRFTSLPGSSFPKTGVSFSGGFIIINRGNVVEDCEILNFNNTGIYVSGLSDSTVIKNCRLYQTSFANSSILTAIEIDAASNVLVTGNSITGFGSTSAGYSILNGILIESLYNIHDCSGVISNNFISLSPDNEANYACISGINYSGKKGHSFKVYYNTILISGTDSYGRFSYCINKTDTASSFTLMDNILVNKRVTLSCPGEQYCIYAEVIPGFHSDYNTFHNGGNAPTVGNWGGIDLYTLEDWKNISKEDTNSNFMSVDFTSSYDLHLSGTSLGNTGLIAQPSDDFIYDIDGERRSLLFPYKGADENTVYPLPVEFVSFNGTIINNEVLLTWQTASETNNSGFYTERKNSNEWVTIAFIPGKINSYNISSYTLVDKPGYGIFTYRLKQVDLDGSFNYSNSISVEVKGGFNFNLGQNYPNPFNPSTTIVFSVPSRQHIALRIYDLLGREIITLVDEVRETGIYKEIFNPGGNLSAGVYLYELKAGAFTETKKMQLIK